MVTCDYIVSVIVIIVVLQFMIEEDRGCDYNAPLHRKYDNCNMER
jgi:hypothetical protein